MRQRNNLSRSCIALFILGMLLLATGCTAQRKEGPDVPPGRTGPVQPGPTDPVAPPPSSSLQPGATTTGNPSDVQSPSGIGAHVVTGVGPELKGRLSDEQKQQIITDSLLILQRLILSTQEQMTLSTGNDYTEAGRDAMTTRLTELGFKVIQTDAWLGMNPSERQQDVFRTDNDCNLAIMMEGSAKSADKFGNFHSFDASMKGKVLNLTTHQIVASKNVLKRGKRALDETAAAKSALEAATADMVTYLTDELARKWEVASLVRMNLTVTGLGHITKADDLRVGLQRRVGVYYVSMESWDERSQTARYEILCRYDVQKFLSTYVDDLRLGHVKVQSVQQRGEVIKARTGKLDIP